MSFNRWKKVRLEEIIEINPKLSIKKGMLAKKVSMEHIREFSRKIQGYEWARYSGGAKFQNGDTLMARITPCLENGKTAFVDILDQHEVGFGSTEFFVIRPKKGKADNKFVYYLSISDEIRNIAIQSMTGTSGRQRAQKESLLNHETKIPPLEIQEKIGILLSIFDDKIELNNYIISKLEQLAQILFKRWFIDFEFPNENGDPYKSSGGKMVQSELGEIPEGWGIGKFKHIADNFDKRRVPLSKLEREKRQGIYPYYGAASILDYVDDYIFDGIYLLVGEDGSVIDDNGNPILQYVWGKFWVNNHAHVIKGKGNFSTEYIYLLLKNTNVSNILTGAVQPKISQRNLNNIHVIMPKEDILGKFNETIDKVFEFIRVYTDETKKLKKLQGILLPKLLSGKIEIPDESAVTEHDLV